MPEQSPPLMIGHSLEHLELHPVAGPTGGREHEAVGHVEEVVGGDPDPHRGELVRLERVPEHPLEVGVGLELRPVGCLGPAVECGIDPLHFHVGTLHDPDRHGFTAGGHPPSGPLADPSLPAERVGHIRLQRDPRPHPLEPRPGQGAHEGLGRERQIAILLHVEVEQLRHPAAIRRGEGRPRSGAVEGLQAVAEPGERVRAGDWQDLRVDRRDLDRQHLDVGGLER